MRYSFPYGCRQIYRDGTHVANIVPPNSGWVLDATHMDDMSRHVGAALSTVTEDVARVLPLPLVEWREAVDTLTLDERQELGRDLDALMMRAARLRGYVDHVESYLADSRHGEAVHASNRLVARVRKALGFTTAADPVSF